MAYENFTTYAVNDVGAVLDVLANSIAATDMDMGTLALVYDDKGAGHFAADFVHDFTAMALVETEATIAFWGVTNTANQRANLWAQGVYFNAATNSPAFQLFELRSKDTTDVDATVNEFWTSGVTYYIRSPRTADTVVQSRIYSDSDRTALEDTLVVSITSGRTYRYVYPMANAWRNIPTFHMSGTSGNLDLHEEAPPEGNVPAAMMHFARLRRAG